MGRGHTVTASFQTVCDPGARTSRTAHLALFPVAHSPIAPAAFRRKLRTGSPGGSPLPRARTLLCASPRRCSSAVGYNRGRRVRPGCRGRRVRPGCRETQLGGLVPRSNCDHRDHQPKPAPLATSDQDGGLWRRPASWRPAGMCNRVCVRCRRRWHTRSRSEFSTVFRASARNRSIPPGTLLVLAISRTHGQTHHARGRLLSLVAEEESVGTVDQGLPPI
jgi:hypothetical protein